VDRKAAGRRWPLSRAWTVAAAVVSLVVAGAYVLLFGGAPLTICWTGVGPAPEPATSECVQRLRDAMSPLQRLWIDNFGVAAAITFVVAFAVSFAALTVITVMSRRLAR